MKRTIVEEYDKRCRLVKKTITEEDDSAQDQPISIIKFHGKPSSAELAEVGRQVTTALKAYQRRNGGLKVL
jgi:hypothetical protein